MIGRVLLAVLLLLPVPALADVTAIYSSGKGGKISLTIEASDDGRARVTYQEKATGKNVTLIYREGTGYVSRSDAHGTLTMRLVDSIMLARESRSFAPMPKALRAAKFWSRPAGSETVAGYVGTVWQIRTTKDGPSGKAEIVVDNVVASNDPALAPLAPLFRAIVPQLIEGLGTFEPNPGLGDMLVELFSKGVPLRFAPFLTLESAEVGPVAADRFDLPGPVMSLEQARTLFPSKPKEPEGPALIRTTP